MVVHFLAQKNENYQKRHSLLNLMNFILIFANEAFERKLRPKNQIFIIMQVFDILILSYTVVHLHLQYRYWVRKDSNVFSKYCSRDLSYEYVSKWVYFTKATWMICLVLLQYFGCSFKVALSYSFFMYSIELLCLFPPKNIYNWLNFILAVGCVLEDIIVRI